MLQTGEEKGKGKSKAKGGKKGRAKDGGKSTAKGGKKSEKGGKKRPRERSRKRPRERRKDERAIPRSGLKKHLFLQFEKNMFTLILSGKSELP